MGLSLGEGGGQVPCGGGGAMTGATPPKRRTRTASATPALRLAVLQRDGWRCRSCGIPLTNTDPKLPTHGHAGHVADHVAGGLPTEANLIALCRLCNQQTGGATGTRQRRNRAAEYEKELQRLRADNARMEYELN